MGSVINDVVCPNCGQDASNDYYYKTGEEITICEHCGYYKSLTIKNRDKQLCDLEDEDWQVVEIDNPYGSYRIKHKDSIAYQVGTLINEEDYEILKKHVFDDGQDIESFTISRFVNDDISIEKII